MITISLQHPGLITDIEQFNTRRDSHSYPPIDVTRSALLYHRYGYEKPITVHGYEWSDTFGKWSVLATFADGWHGFTYQK